MDYTVSVVMATYNGEKYIREQIDSIISQTVMPDEIIVIDDASSDKTVELIRLVLGNTSIDYSITVHNTNEGVSKSFQDGIIRAKSDFIMICDQDDVWKPRKIEMTKSAIDSETTLVVCNATLVGSELQNMGQTMFDYIGLPLSFYNSMISLTSREMMLLSLKRNYVTGMCMAGRRDIILDSFPIPDTMTYDTWLAWNLANKGNTKFIKDELVYYRQHSNNVIGTKKRKENLKEYYKHRIKDKKAFLNKYNSLSKADIRDEVVSNTLEDAICFYEDRLKINTLTAPKAFGLIKKNNKKGYYKRFCGSKRKEILKDIVEVVAFRRISTTAH